MFLALKIMFLKENLRTKKKTTHTHKYAQIMYTALLPFHLKIYEINSTKNFESIIVVSSGRWNNK